MSCMLGRSNALFPHFNLLETLEGEQKFDQVGGRIFVCLFDHGGERVGDGGVECDALDHQSGQVEAHALVGGEFHLSSEFGAVCGKTQGVAQVGNHILTSLLGRYAAWG